MPWVQRPRAADCRMTQIPLRPSIEPRLASKQRHRPSRRHLASYRSILMDHENESRLSAGFLSVAVTSAESAAADRREGARRRVGSPDSGFQPGSGSAGWPGDSARVTTSRVRSSDSRRASRLRSPLSLSSSQTDGHTMYVCPTRMMTKKIIILPARSNWNENK